MNDVNLLQVPVAASTSASGRDGVGRVMGEEKKVGWEKKGGKVGGGKRETRARGKRMRVDSRTGSMVLV